MGFSHYGFEGGRTVVSTEDGTRTKPKEATGPAWNQILNIEFNFRLRGLVSLKDS